MIYKTKEEGQKQKRKDNDLQNKRGRTNNDLQNKRGRDL